MKAKLTSTEIKRHSPQVKRYKIWDTEIKGYYLLVLPSGTKSLYLFYRMGGKAYDYSIGKIGKHTAGTGRDEAIRLAASLTKNENIQLIKQNKALQFRRDKQLTFEKFIESEYKPHVQANLRSHIEVMRVLGKDFAFLDSRKMDSLTPFEIRKWCNDQLKKGLNPSTINRRIGILKSVLSYAVEGQFIAHSPLAGTRQLKEDTNYRVRFLEPTEEKRLRAALHAHQDAQRTGRENHNAWLHARHKTLRPSLSDTFTDYLMPMILLAINTGMRRGELFRLTWNRVDLSRKLLTVTAPTAKSRKTRHIPLNQEALNTLSSWRNQSGDNTHNLVFPSPVTGLIFDNIKSAWKSLIIKKAKVEDFRLHDLRHHFASKLVMRGVDLLTVKELLGHSKIEMTLRYAHLAPEHKAAAVELLNAAQ